MNKPSNLTVGSFDGKPAPIKKGCLEHQYATADLFCRLPIS
jgi:hypothetical protein